MARPVNADVPPRMVNVPALWEDLLGARWHDRPQ
jgi:hypothetical protein